MARNTAYRNLDVYQESKKLVLEVYALIKKFPSEERFAMCDQLRRSVTSVPSNIAEGFGRISPKEQVHFIEIAYGSLMEVETQLDIAADLAYTYQKLSLTTYQKQQYKILQKCYPVSAPVVSITSNPFISQQGIGEGTLRHSFAMEEERRQRWL